MKKIKKIYIAGKIGTYNAEQVSQEVIDKFAVAEHDLEIMYNHCFAVNPLKIAMKSYEKDILFQGELKKLKNFTDKQQERYLKNENICMLTSCNAIYLLTDWENSEGAKIEKEIAEFLGLEIIYQ